MRFRTALLMCLPIAAGLSGCEPAWLRASDDLAEAASEGDATRVRSLLLRGANPNEFNDTGRTPLMLAAIEGKTEVIRILLASGADPSIHDSSGQTALTFAGNPESIAILRNAILGRSRGAQASRSFLNEQLVDAAAKGDIPSIRALVAKGADPNGFNLAGDTPLFAACGAGESPSVKALLRLGADPNERSKTGMRPIDNKPNAEIRKLLASWRQANRWMVHRTGAKG